MAKSKTYKVYFKGYEVQTTTFRNLPDNADHFNAIEEQARNRFDAIEHINHAGRTIKVNRNPQQ